MPHCFERFVATMGTSVKKMKSPLGNNKPLWTKLPKRGGGRSRRGPSPCPQMLVVCITGLTVRLAHHLCSLYVSDDWVKCDDDNISMVKSDDILKLSGGGRMDDTTRQKQLFFRQRRLCSGLSTNDGVLRRDLTLRSMNSFIPKFKKYSQPFFQPS